MQKKKRNSTLIIVLICIALVGISALAIFVPRMFGLTGTSANVTVTVPVFTTTLTSAGDGEDYVVQTAFSVQMDRQTRFEVDDTLLREALTEIMAGMDVTALQQDDGIDYLNAQVTEALNEYLSATSQVYVSDFIISDQIQLAGPPAQSGEVMEGLFDGMD